MSGFHNKPGGFVSVAAIDARPLTGQRRHDMAAALGKTGNAKPWLGWVRGPGRHGGGAPAMCVGPMM